MSQEKKMKTTKGKTVVKLAIMSKREGATEWGTRNASKALEDSESGDFETRYRRVMAVAEKEVQRWMAVEPSTQFLIEDRSF
jgi:hypothetical protein